MIVQLMIAAVHERIVADKENYHKDSISSLSSRPHIGSIRGEMKDYSFFLFNKEMNDYSACIGMHS